jgi:hypothetical protein
MAAMVALGAARSAPAVAVWTIHPAPKIPQRTVM